MIDTTTVAAATVCVAVDEVGAVIEMGGKGGGESKQKTRCEKGKKKKKYFCICIHNSTQKEGGKTRGETHPSIFKYLVAVECVGEILYTKCSPASHFGRYYL